MTQAQKPDFVFRRNGWVHLCRWADKCHLHCNISIYIKHIWIKSVLCSRMVSLFHHTSPWTHRCLQSSPSAHRNGRVFRRSVQTACCYWILSRGKSPSNWNSQTNASRLRWSVCWFAHNKSCVRRFKDGELGQTDLSDKTRSGSPVTTSDQLHQDRVQELIRGDFIEK